ncbi:hypothetical protein HDV00_010379 [Rhizophlyctis rosea]|nr:hypothetical protein HDV00_010379 [Rhizophlyctis rosea]
MSTTEVQNFSSRLVQVVTAHPTDSLADTLESFSGTPLLLCNTEQAVGRKPWTVFTRDDTELAQRVTLLEGSLAAVQENVANLQTTVDADAMLYGRAFLRNGASEILLFALGRQPRPPYSTNYFATLANDGSAELSAVVATLNQILVAPTTETGLAGILDDVIERRNGFYGTIHYSNRQDLETNALVPARNLLTRHTQLRTSCPREFLVVDNYETFQSAFNF